MMDHAALIIPRGFRASSVKAGIKPSGGLDLAILAADGPCAAAGTFTTNRVCAAPVKWCRELLPSEDIRAVVVNSGNANAATGAEGLANARRTAVKAAGLLGCRPEQVLVASTGVIGHQLPMDRLEAGLEQAAVGLSADSESFRTAARSIMTTDTHPKIVCERRDDRRPRGDASGHGQGGRDDRPADGDHARVPPDRRTRSGPTTLRDILADAVDSSFNCLTVEGHASTNDTVLLLSSTASVEPILSGDDVAAFAEMVRAACESLARQIADDGEGATHFITIDVEGCESAGDARAIARTVAESALVKTAIHGADPNWGRIVSAAGYAGVAFAGRRALALDQRSSRVSSGHSRPLRRRGALRLLEESPGCGSPPGADLG